MFILKKAWVTPGDGLLFCLSIESDRVNTSQPFPLVDESVFPAEPTPKNPRRHVAAINCLDAGDLRMIRDAINLVLREE